MMALQWTVVAEVRVGGNIRFAKFEKSVQELNQIDVDCGNTDFILNKTVDFKGCNLWLTMPCTTPDARVNISQNESPVHRLLGVELFSRRLEPCLRGNESLSRLLTRKPHKYDTHWGDSLHKKGKLTNLWTQNQRYADFESSMPSLPIQLGEGRTMLQRGIRENG